MRKDILPRLSGLVLLFIFQSSVCIAQDKLSGSATVSPTGAAVYSIPIEVPKGVGDLMPSIGIAYNSQTGNGIVGWGCNITGLSSITRGLKDWAHDDTVRGVNYDNISALYLDGKRLLLKSGSEGSDGCVYSPEGEPQTTVTLHSYLSSSTCWFEVDTSDGIVYEYGHTDGRQTISNPTAVTAWYISKATNPLNQSITYLYYADGLYLYPQTITYGGNNSIQFVYENRTDTIPFVLRNNGGYVTKRLKSITTKAGNETYRTYTMAYSYADATVTKFSRLYSITETGEDGHSTHVLYANWNNLPSFTETCQQTSITVPSSFPTTEYGERYLLAGDMNKDGISDVIHVSPVTILNSNNMYEYHTYIRLYRSSIENGIISYENQSSYSFPEAISFDDWSFKKGVSSIADMDGDGVNDLIIPHCNNANNSGTYIFHFKVAYGSETGSSSSCNYFAATNLLTSSDIPLYAVTDLNNNGKNDIVLLEKSGQNGTYTLQIAESSKHCSYQVKYISLSSAPKRLFTSDFNHDGLTDIIVICSNGSYIFYNQGGSNLQNLFLYSSTLNTSLTNHDRMEMGDFNGDGIADFIWNDDNSSYLYFETGNADGSFTRHLAYDLGFNTYYKNRDCGTWSCMVLDLDHDGKSDVVLNVGIYLYQGFPFNLVYFSSKTYWFISNGTTLTKKKEASSVREDDAKAGHIFAGDFQGQGFLEVGNYGYDCYNGSNANTDPTINLYKNNNHNISNGKLVSFTDSHGRSTSFSYASMTSDQVYTKGTSASYPVMDIVAPLCVTSQINETGASPMSTQTVYKYTGLRAHLTGRGLLGFRQTEAYESNTGKKVTTTTSNDNPIFFVPTTITTTTIQDGKSSTVANHFNLNIYNYNGQNNYALFPTWQLSTDIYGNLTEVIRTFDMDKGILMTDYEEKDDGDFYRETTYTYGSTKVAHAWRPVSVDLEQKHPDDNNAFTKRTTISYYNNGKKSSVVEFQNTTKPLTTSYQYDVNGNVTSETLSGYGIPNGTVTTYQYSNDGKFLTQKSDAAGTTSYTRNAFGEVMAETDLTDPNHPLTVNYTRNGFGLLTQEDKPSGEETEWERGTSSYYGGAYYIVTHKYGSPEVTTYFDTFGNELYTETTAFGDVTISTANTYNEYGKVEEQERTYGDLTITDSYEYDGLGRVTNFTSTDGREIDYSYADRTVTVTRNDNDYVKTYDVWGNITESADPLSSVSYTYSSNGKPVEIECDGNTVEISYDGCGDQTEFSDPDAGTTTYETDALHRVIEQTDARGYVSTFTFDGAGRLTGKTVDGETTYYTYGTSGGAAGRLTEVENSDCSIEYTYDDSGLLSEETHTIDGVQSLTFGYSYDSDGRLTRKSYPQNVNVDYTYAGDYLLATSVNGRNINFLKLDNGLIKICTYGGKLKNTAPGFIDHPITGGFGGTAQLMDWPSVQPNGNPELIYNPDSIITPGVLYTLDDYYYVQGGIGTKTATYDSRGYLNSLAMYRGQTKLREMEFEFEDGTGNLLSRTGMTSQDEEFSYDYLDRLVSACASSNQSFSYSTDGNITYKSGAGSISYGLTRPHAVTGAGNEGAISSMSQSVSYTPFGKIQSIYEDGFTMDFTYGPDGQRWMSELRDGNPVVRTVIYGNDYEQVTDANGQTRHFYFLDDGAVYVLNDGTSANTGRLYFAFTDHLGSITRLYSEYGNVVFNAEYDAWGKQTVTVDSLDFHRGYTGHEMMPEFGLINMNGRLYDPALGRFLSPDNYVQLPDFSQSFNRYSYCLNNPLKYTDPSGEFFGLDDAIIIGICIAGAANVWANWDDIQLDWGHGIASFIIGAGSAALGMVNPIFGTVALGASNSIVNQLYNGNIDWEQVGLSTGMSLLTYGIGQKIGSLIDTSVSKITSKVKNVVVEKWLNGAIDGTIGGFTLGTLFSLGNGENVGNALENGGKNAIEGFIIGSMNGLNQGYHLKETLKSEHILPSGFKSFEDFKKVYGRAGDGMEWHHIVEQRDANIKQFGPEKIHNIDNMIALPADVHRKISGFYSSKKDFTHGLTVRQWLNGQSYAAQYEFGLSVLKKYGY